MANLILYFEMLSKQLATSEQGQLGFQLPTFGQEDTLDLEISLMRRVNEIRQPLYEVENVAGWSLRVSVGSVLGTADATTITFNPDATGKKLLGQLALNTAGLNALADQSRIYFEIIASKGTSKYRKRFETLWEKAIYTSGSLVAPAGDTALGLIDANNRFVKREGAAGEGFILTSPAGQRAYVYLRDDKSLAIDPIT